MSWQKLKNLIQSIKPADFEKLVARLLELHLETPFVVARSGDQPRGDARSMSSDISMQAKRYTGEKPPNAKTIEGDIREAIRESPHLQVYVLAITRDTEQTKRYLENDYAKERNLGVSILPWFGTCDAIKELERLISDDQSKWVRDHATWAYEVAQQERSCQETYQEALQTRNLFRISAVFEQIEPALLLTAQRWHYEIEKKEGLHAESQEVDPKLLALLYRFWDQWENSLRTKSNFEVFGRKLREYCRGEKLPTIEVPRIAPWWKPTSSCDNL